MGVGDADKGVEMLAQVGLARGLGEGQQAGKGKGVADDSAWTRVKKQSRSMYFLFITSDSFIPFSLEGS